MKYIWDLKNKSVRLLSMNVVTIWNCLAYKLENVSRKFMQLAVKITWNPKLLLRSESPSGKCANPHTVAASNNRHHSVIACPRHIYVGFILRAHPVRGESHVQRNANGQVATASPPLYSEPHRSHVLSEKAAPGTTFTSWSQHHFFAIGKPERQVRNYESNQQQRSHAMTLLLHVRATYIYRCYSSRTSHSWWIPHSPQRQRRGCNTIISRRFIKKARNCTWVYCFAEKNYLDRWNIKRAKNCGLFAFFTSMLMEETKVDNAIQDKQFEKCEKDVILTKNITKREKGDAFVWSFLNHQTKAMS